MKNANNFPAKAFLKNAQKSVMGLSVMIGLASAAQAQNIFPATGNVGIGTTTPAYPIHMANSAASINMQIDGTNSAWTGMYMRNSTATGIPYYAFTANGTTAWTQLTPAGKWSLHLGGERLSVLNTNGFVGIGTAAPGFKLDVVGRIRLGNDAGGSGSGAWLRNSANTADVGFMGLANDNHIGFWGNTGAGWALNVNTTNGNVGIGTLTTSTVYKLSVNGSIRAKELVVETGWADFVFAKNYRLRPLAEVESYINANHHLPDVPSAAEVQENGVKLGEMQTTLLQKIEELTLYTIQQNKEIEALKAQLNQILEKK